MRVKYWECECYLWVVFLFGDKMLIDLNFEVLECDIKNEVVCLDVLLCGIVWLI